MLEEQGSVVETTPAGVVVETIRQSACGSCAASKGCGQKLLSDIGQRARFRVVANNPHELVLNAGDRVVLGLQESKFLTASLMVYLVPLLLMVAAAVLFSSLGVAEPWVVLAGLFGLGVGLLGIRHWGPRGEAGCQYQPEIIRKVL